MIHVRTPHIGGINGDLKYDLSTLSFNNGEQIEYFHRIIIGLQKEINLSVYNVSPTRLLLHYMKEL